MDEKSESGGGKRTPFNMIHRDLDRALGMARLEGLEAVLMTVARELSYGRAQQISKIADPLPFRFSLKAISRRWGGTRCNLRAARERLIADRLLTETPDGLIINKRYDQWQGAHALTPQQVETAREGRRRDAIDKYGEGGSRTGHPPVARPQATLNTCTGPVDRPRGWPVDRPPLAAPLINPPLDGDRETSVCSTRARTGAPAGADGRAGAREATPAADVIELASRLSAGTLGRWATSACELHPPEWVLALVKRKLVGHQKLPRVGLLNAILEQWERDGECEYLVAPAAPPREPRPNATRPSEDREAYRAKLYSDLEGL